MKISTRLILLVAVLSVLLIGVGLLGLSGMAASNAGLKSVYEDRTVVLGQLGDIQARMLMNANLVASATLEATPEAVARNGQEVEANIAEITRQWKAYMATYLTPEEEQIAKRFTTVRSEYVSGALRPALAALKKGDFDAARHISNDLVPGLWAPARREMMALIELQLRVAKSEYEVAVARFETIRRVAIAAIVTGVLGAIALGGFLVAGIGRALAQANALAGAIAAGDLRVQIDTSGRDEIASLLRGLVQMKDGLAAVVHKVRSGSEGVATASAEIAQGNHDLSSRTESQASALEETASSMEELDATVKHNADSAREANEMARKASGGRARWRSRRPGGRDDAGDQRGLAPHRRHHRRDRWHRLPDQHPGAERGRRGGPGRRTGARLRRRRRRSAHPGRPCGRGSARDQAADRQQRRAGRARHGAGGPGRQHDGGGRRRDRQSRRADA